MEKDIVNKKPDQSIPFAIAEIAFILLPFMVMIITFAYKDNLVSLLEEPEWSLAASVMFGQSIIKLFYAVIKGPGKSVYEYRVGAIIAGIILIGLVPSLTILSLIFISTIVPVWIIVLQLILFIISAILFFAINALQNFNSES